LAVYDNVVLLNRIKISKGLQSRAVLLNHFVSVTYRQPVSKKQIV